MAYQQTGKVKSRGLTITYYSDADKQPVSAAIKRAENALANLRRSRRKTNAG